MQRGLCIGVWGHYRHCLGLPFKASLFGSHSFATGLCRPPIQPTGAMETRRLSLWALSLPHTSLFLFSSRRSCHQRTNGSKKTEQKQSPIYLVLTQMKVQDASSPTCVKKQTPSSEPAGASHPQAISRSICSIRRHRKEEAVSLSLEETRMS